MFINFPINLIRADACAPVSGQGLQHHTLVVGAQGGLLGGGVVLHELIVGGELGTDALLALVLACTAGRAGLLQGALLGYAHLTHLLGGADHLTDCRLGLGAGRLPELGNCSGDLAEGCIGHLGLELLPLHLAEVGIGRGTHHLAHLAGLTHRLTRRAGLAAAAHRLAGGRAAAHRGLGSLAGGRAAALGGLRLHCLALGGLHCLAGRLGSLAALGGAGTRFTCITSCHFLLYPKK